MNAIKEIRQDLIDEIMNMDDVDALNALYKTIEQHKKTSQNSVVVKIDDATVKVKKGYTLDQIVTEQNLKQITYSEISEIVENTAWEISLDELLAGID